MARSRPLRFVLTLLVLVAAVAVPPVVEGILALQSADVAFTAGHYVGAAKLYGIASGLLPWRADLLEKSGAAAFAAGDYGASIQLLLTAQRRGRLSARGWEQLGAAYWARGEHPLAISGWLAGSQAFPGDGQLLSRLASAYHQEADYEAEQATLERRLKLGEDATAHYGLGLLLLASDPDRAAQHLESAASLDAEFGPATNTLLAASQASSREPDAAQTMLILGRGLGLVEQWGLATREFSRATEIRPAGQDAEAWAWLGEAEQHLGQDGLRELDRALAADPRDGTVHILRGLYFRRQDKNSEAIREYARAAELEPRNPAVQSSLGEAYAANGDLVAALAAYQDATSIASADADYWRLLALFCADNDVQVAEIGLPAAQKAAQIEPKDPEVLDALGWSYAQAGYFDQAEKALRKAVDAPTASASSHVHLAVLYLRLGENAQALEQLNGALQINSTGPTAKSARRLLAKYFPDSAVPQSP